MDNKKNVPKPVLFFDCGDTIIDEATQVRNNEDVVMQAEPIPGAVEMIQTLYESGYRLCLVADGLYQDFKNLLTQHGIYDCFESFIVSEAVRAQKPSQKMFLAAMGAMLLEANDASGIVMIGNNLKKDIAGANRLGMGTIWLNWSPRYMQEPQLPEEVPDYVAGTPEEILEILEHFSCMETLRTVEPTPCNVS